MHYMQQCVDKTEVSNDLRLETERGMTYSLCFGCRLRCMTTFTLYFHLAVFSFSETLSSFALTSKVRIILHYSRRCTNFFQENINANLTFAVTAVLKLTNKKRARGSQICNEQPRCACGELFVISQ